MAERKINVPDFVKDSLQTAMEPLNKLEGKAKEIMDRVVKEGTLSQKDLKKPLNDILKWVKDAQGGVEKSVNDGLQKTFTFLNIPSRDEFKKLETKVNKLSRELNTLKPKAKKAKKAAKK